MMLGKAMRSPKGSPFAPRGEFADRLRWLHELASRCKPARRKVKSDGGPEVAALDDSLSPSEKRVRLELGGG